MQTVFRGKKITGMLGVLPQTVYEFDEETKNFPTIRASRLKKIMGYGRRRRVKKETTTSDMCLFGMRYLLDNNMIDKDDIGAIIVVTMTPDYFIPHVSNIIHGECEFSDDVICVDIPQACTGLLLGLMEAFMLLDHMKDKKAVIFTGDVLCRKTMEQEVFEEPPFGGDAATITIVENDSNAEDIYFDLRMDGRERNCLIMPAGAFKFPWQKQGVKVDVGDGVLREANQLNMDGSAVFNFVQREVPPLIHDLMIFSGMKEEDIDWYLFHQPNKFMLQKLADKLGVPYEKMFMNIVEEFGNSSGSVIGINIVYNLGKELKEHVYNCCLSAFGGGMSWGAMIIKLGKMDFCEMIESSL